MLYIATLFFNAMPIIKYLNKQNLIMQYLTIRRFTIKQASGAAGWSRILHHKARENSSIYGTGNMEQVSRINTKHRKARRRIFECQQDEKKKPDPERMRRATHASPSNSHTPLLPSHAPSLAANKPYSRSCHDYSTGSIIAMILQKKPAKDGVPQYRGRGGNQGNHTSP